jgi:hypothetical protein
MKLSAFKALLDTVPELNFLSPDNVSVPKHFHVTEAGVTTKHFIDCGGTVRTEKHINFQLWVAEDYDHRLAPQKLKKIIALADHLFDNQDLEIEIEYQTQTVGRYGIDFDGVNFILTPKQTDCLARGICIPPPKTKVKLSKLQTVKTTTACCTPGQNCC